MIKIELAEITDLDRIMKIIEACATDLISKQIFQWSKKYPNREVFKDDIKISGLLSERFFTISLCTLGVAVAVNAIMGADGLISSIISFKRRYSGLKSCPHSEIQCASSTAKKDTFKSLKKSRFSCFVKVSGATYNNLVLPLKRSSLTTLTCPLFKEEFKKYLENLGYNPMRLTVNSN